MLIWRVTQSSNIEKCNQQKFMGLILEVEYLNSNLHLKFDYDPNSSSNSKLSKLFFNRNLPLFVEKISLLKAKRNNKSNFWVES